MSINVTHIQASICAHTGARIDTLIAEYPRVIHAQLLTHRCLAGDSELVFDLPSGQRRATSDFRRNTMEIQEFHRKWHEGDSKGRSMRHRLNKMKIRMLNEDTNKVEHTTITDIWEVGEKETYKLTAGNKNITATDDHLILTTDGWKELQDIAVGDYIISSGFGVQNPTDPTIHKKINGQWTTVWNRQNLPIVAESQGHECANCKCTSALELHHLKPVHSHPELAFELTNVVAVCEDCHNNHYHKTQDWQVSQELLGKPIRVKSIEPVGIQMVYDLTVASKYHNFVANDIVVHNCFSKNSSSTRAIPLQKAIEQIVDNPVEYVWTKNQAGMQGVVIPKGKQQDDLEIAFNFAKSNAIDNARTLLDLGAHKQNAGRLLEPFQNIRIVLSSTEWENWDWLRDHEAAQGEIADLARMIKDARDSAIPMVLQPGELHVPFVDRERNLSGKLQYGILGQVQYTDEEALLVSMSVCAQTSYRNSDYSLEKAIDMRSKLLDSDHVHASPSEHQAIGLPYGKLDSGDFATVMFNLPEGVTHVDRKGNLWSGNFKGWIQARQLIKGHDRALSEDK